VATDLYRCGGCVLVGVGAVTGYTVTLASGEQIEFPEATHYDLWDGVLRINRSERYEYQRKRTTSPLRWMFWAKPEERIETATNYRDTLLVAFNMAVVVSFAPNPPTDGP